MKRKATNTGANTKIKRQKGPELEYCDTPPRKDDEGNILWPAHSKAIEDARAFLREWYVQFHGMMYNIANCMHRPSAASGEKTMIVPDKDADGLDAGVIIYRTLTTLGLPPSMIDVHLVGKGSSIHDEVERLAMKEKGPKFIIVVDQGSRPGPPVVDEPETKSLIIDHHMSDEFPQGATVRSDSTVQRQC